MVLLCQSSWFGFYNAIGNILTSPAGSYQYAGTLYANPHAVTFVGGVTYAHNAFGNLSTITGVLNNNWNYRNQLTQTIQGSTTTLNYYDHNGNRVKYALGATSTTYYPNMYYNVNGNKRVKSYYAGDMLLATTETVSGVTTPYYNHSDHLNSTTAVTNSSGTQIQTLDYLPFGNTRIDSGTDVSQREYIGQIFDEETGFSYLNARHYKSNIGRFISEDPVFWEIGQTDDGKKTLMDPQSQNSYSYARNNPIINKDPEGRYWETAFDVAMLSWSISDFKENPGFWNGLGVVADGAGLALPIPAVIGGLRHGDDAYRGFRIAQDVAKTSNWGNPVSLMQHTLDHAADFGLKKTDYAGYAKATNNFLSEAETAIKQGNKNFESFTDANNRTFLFDKKTSTFGIKNADGTAATAYKPKGGDPQKALDYWNKQKTRYNSKK